MKNDTAVSVVIPNWNGASSLRNCLDSLESQSFKAHIIVVDNGSVDHSVAVVENHYPSAELIVNNKNLGFAGGVNVGIRQAIEKGAKFVALLNNDAVADKNWLKSLVDFLDAHPEAGIATCKLLSSDGIHLDSTGECYSHWGLPYPRGRGEKDLNKYDAKTDIFAASGAASLYRTEMFEEIGLFDEDFFAYYEDVDLSFRAQLAGWKVAYVPNAVVRHATGTTSSKIKGFTTYQAVKNHPLLLWKNVPWSFFPRVWIRMALAWSGFVIKSLIRGQFWPVLKACVVVTMLWPKKLIERQTIQKNRKVSDEYIWNMVVHDLPPNARALRRLRAAWWKLRGKSDD